MDLELVIKISNNYILSNIKNGSIASQMILNAVKNGTPLPKGHGDLIDRNLALNDNGLCEFHMYDDYVKMRNYLKSIPTIIEAERYDK